MLHVVVIVFRNPVNMNQREGPYSSALLSLGDVHHSFIHSCCDYLLVTDVNHVTARLKIYCDHYLTSTLLTSQTYTQYLLVHTFI